MASPPRAMTDPDVDVNYPTRDGRPMGETELHRNKMQDLITTLDDYFAAKPDVYVGGDLLVFYERGDRRKHISPDVFVCARRSQAAHARSLPDLARGQGT